MNEPVKKPSRNNESYKPGEKPEIIRLTDKYRQSSTIDEIKAFIQSHGEPPRESNKITNIRRLWHDNKSENFMLEGSFASVMKAIGERSEYTYWFFNALCGSAFVMPYNPNGGNDNGFSFIFIPELVKHAFEICGYECLYIDEQTIKENYNVVMGAIKTSVDRNVPVITAGVGNFNLKRKDKPEEHMGFDPNWAVVGGYEADNMFLVNVWHERIETDDIGYIKTENGLENSKGIFILTGKVSNPDIKDIYQNIILSIPALLSVSPNAGYVFGKDAYYKWAETLLDDSIFENKFDSWALFNSAWVTVGTNGVFFRGDFMGHFMKTLTEELPDFTTAQKVYDLYSKKMGEKFSSIHKTYSPDFFEFFINDEQLKNRDNRVKFAALLKEAGDIHDEIIEVINNGV